MTPPSLGWAVAEKSKNVLANQRPGRSSWITDRLEKHKLGRGRWGLTSCHVLSKSIQRLRRRSRKMFQPIRGLGGHLGWPIGTKKHKLGRGRRGLASCKVSSKYVQWFLRRRKCEKLTTDRQTTDDGHRVITMVHLSLRLMCTKNYIRLAIFTTRYPFSRKKH